MSFRHVRIRYRLNGAYVPPWRTDSASQWQADTIFGRLCWTYLRRHSAADLTCLLRRYEAGDPPLILSNGFPGDYLPRPLLMPVLPTAPRTLADKRHAAMIEKDQRNISLLTRDEFLRAINGQPLGHLTMAGRREALYTTTRMRNSLHRLTNTTTGPDGAVEDSGALFTMPVAYTPHICIYAKIADDFLTEAEALFADLEHWGFGKHASIGLGAVSCEEHWFEECPELRCAGEANGFVALSHFAPAREDPTDGRWRLLVKYGKFGDTRATTIPSGSDDAQPFKRPVIMLEAGATFRCHPVRPWYGRLLAGLSAYYSDARQYAYCYAVPCRV